MPNYKLTIEYDGTDFNGWQIQPNARTVEGDIEAALEQIFQQTIDVVGQGRTDAGVHAKNQTAHMLLNEEIKRKELRHKLNRMTKGDVAIKKIEQISDDFHSRFDASSRLYEYKLLIKPSPLNERYAYVLPRKLDIAKLMSAAGVFIGEHDFEGFSKKNDDQLTSLCTVYESEFIMNNNEIVYRIRANRFLRNMVRRIVGAMIMVGEGKETPQDLEDVLNKRKIISIKTAPAKGLTLMNVFY